MAGATASDVKLRGCTPSTRASDRSPSIHTSHFTVPPSASARSRGASSAADDQPPSPSALQAICTHSSRGNRLIKPQTERMVAAAAVSLVTPGRRRRRKRRLRAPGGWMASAWTAPYAAADRARHVTASAAPASAHTTSSTITESGGASPGGTQPHSTARERARWVSPRRRDSAAVNVAATIAVSRSGGRSRRLRPFLSISFVHVTLSVTSSQLGKVTVGRPFV